MTITGAIVVFVIGWWLAFFAVLPIGIRSQYEEGDTTPGTDEGAPAQPMIVKKMIWATGGGLAIVILAAIVIPRFFSP